MNSMRKSPMVNLLSLLVTGAVMSSASMAVSANERRDAPASASMAGLTGRPANGLRELSLQPFVLDRTPMTHGAAEASAVEAEALAPYLEMHGRAAVGLRPVILPWSVRMESVN